MKIPYGISDFGTIRSKGYFYVDKTPFLPVLESGELGYVYLMFLRPRRFGKSTLVSMLSHYYDLAAKDSFDELFKGLWIHEHPTPERNSYLILSFDFSQVATHLGPEALLRTFFLAVKSGVQKLLMKYREQVPELRRLEAQLDTLQDPEGLVIMLTTFVRGAGHSMYVLIDEYDQFANRLLSGGAEDLYEEVIVQGFVRSFYTTLKAGTSSGAIGRIFITGVTPLMLDDLSSGFNILSNTSQDRDLNTLAGFTRADVERAVDELLATRPAIAELPELNDRQKLLEVLERYYNGYRFSVDETERVFNSDMVLYFLSEVVKTRRYPTEMLDRNVRTEYSHLQRIGAISGTAAPQRRALLETILAEGHIRSELSRGFGVKSLPSHRGYLSLLYYLGMLTFSHLPRDLGGYDLEIPNRVIRELQWEHLALMLREQSKITVSVDDLEMALHTMAALGDIQPFLDLFHERVLKRIGVKDMRNFGEKTLKLMLMTYISLGRTFHVLSEKELAQGYCDLFLGASHGAPSAKYAWLLELKYLPSNAKPAQIEAAFAEAAAQVERYASDKDLLPMLLGDRQLKAGMLVFPGAKRPHFRPWPPIERPIEKKKPRSVKPRSVKPRSVKPRSVKPRLAAPRSPPRSRASRPPVRRRSSEA